MTAVVLNQDLANQGAETGMLLAASHADRESKQWTEMASKFFECYAKMHREGFMTEEVRAWATKLGFQSPPDARAWGYIARKLANDGVIEASGYGRQRSSTCHGSPKTIWKLK